MLAIADLSVGIRSIVVFFGLISDFPELLGKTLAWIQAIVLVSAALHVVLVALDRFIAIIYPLFYTTKMNTSHIVKLSIFMWVIALVTSLGEFLVIFEGYFSLEISDNIRDDLRVIPFLTFYFLLALVLCFLHCRITVTAVKVKRRRNARQNTDSNEENQKPFKMDRATKIMLIILLVYLLLWAPFVIINIIAAARVPLDPFVYFGASEFGLVAGHYNSAINFIIYAGFNEKLRNAFKKQLRIKQRDSNQTSGNVYTVSGPETTI